MKSKNKIILIGAIRNGQKPVCGETMKNQLFLKRFRELFEKVDFVDTYRWQKHPWCLVHLFFVLLFNKKAKFVISGSGATRYLIHLIYKTRLKRDVYFWVVGGDLHIAVQKGQFDIDALNSLKYILVQGQPMVDELLKLGVENAVFVPNSKPITFHPQIKRHDNSEPFRFVFLSRIHPNKGIKEIISASEELNSEGFEGRFMVDFWGGIDKDYEQEFLKALMGKKHLNYRGYMDLTNEDGYELLSSYDIMLFPTYWHGEGFPGVVLDANISGVPIIATDWNLNKFFINDGETGILIPPHDSNALTNAMRSVIKNEIDLEKMKLSCNAYIQQYDSSNVLSIELMKNLKLYE